MFLTLFDKDEKVLQVIVFGSDGKAEIVGSFDASKRVIRNAIKNDESIKSLGARWCSRKNGTPRSGRKEGSLQSSRISDGEDEYLDSSI